MVALGFSVRAGKAAAGKLTARRAGRPGFRRTTRQGERRMVTTGVKAGDDAVDDREDGFAVREISLAWVAVTSTVTASP